MHQHEYFTNDVPEFSASESRKAIPAWVRHEAALHELRIVAPPVREANRRGGSVFSDDGKETGVDEEEDEEENEEKDVKEEGTGTIHEESLGDDGVANRKGAKQWDRRANKGIAHKQVAEAKWTSGGDGRWGGNGVHDTG